jgi:hypothetical protein
MVQGKHKHVSHSYSVWLSLRKSTLMYWFWKDKWKVLLLCAKQAQRERGGVAVLLLDLGSRRFTTTHQPLYPWERDPVPILQDAGWAGLNGSRKSCPHRGLNPGSSSLQQVNVLNELCTDSVCFRTVERRVIPSHFWNWLWTFLVVLKTSGRICVRFEDRIGRQLSG